MAKIGAKAAHFLTQKPWTPWNPRNQERIWKAEQELKDRERRELERAEMIKKQADLEEQSRLVTSLGGSHTHIRESASHPLHFMYAPPPGMAGGRKDGEGPPIDPSRAGLGTRTAGAQAGAQAGVGVEAQAREEEDDDVKAFKAAFAAAVRGKPAQAGSQAPAQAGEGASSAGQAPKTKLSSRGVSGIGAAAAALRAVAAPPAQPQPSVQPVAPRSEQTISDDAGRRPAWLDEVSESAAQAEHADSSAAPVASEAEPGHPGVDEEESEKERKRGTILRKQTELEKLAGKKAVTGLSRDELVERFPFLAGAPVEGEYAKKLNALHFQPLGKSVRNVRCLRCKQWGHESTDKECPMFNVNPRDVERVAREDPMAALGLAAAGERGESAHGGRHDDTLRDALHDAPAMELGDDADVSSTPKLTLKPSALAATGASATVVETAAALREARRAGTAPEAGWGGVGGVPGSRPAAVPVAPPPRASDHSDRHRDLHESERGDDRDDRDRLDRQGRERHELHDRHDRAHEDHHHRRRHRSRRSSSSSRSRSSDARSRRRGSRRHDGHDEDADRKRRHNCYEESESRARRREESPRRGRDDHDHHRGHGRDDERELRADERDSHRAAGDDSRRRERDDRPSRRESSRTDRYYEDDRPTRRDDDWRGRERRSADRAVHRDRRDRD